MSKANAAPLKPFPSHAVAWSGAFDVPRFALRYRHLSLAAMGENYHVGVAIEELLPGKQSSPAHYHIFEEDEIPLSDTMPAAIETPVTPKPPISSQDVSWHEMELGKGFFDRNRHLTYAAVGEDYHVGILIEAPPPGMRGRQGIFTCWKRSMR